MSGFDDLGMGSPSVNPMDEKNNPNQGIIMQKILDSNAMQRLNNLKMVKPKIAAQFEMYLMQVYQSGQINKPLTESQIIQILDKIMPKKDFNIQRR